MEWSLSEMEANAAPLLRSFASDWPLTGDDKLTLAVEMRPKLAPTPFVSGTENLTRSVAYG
jgi:hypothetical protein